MARLLLVALVALYAPFASAGLIQTIQKAVDTFTDNVNQNKVDNVVNSFEPSGSAIYPGEMVATGLFPLTTLYLGMLPLPYVVSQTVIHVQPLQVESSGDVKSVFAVTEYVHHDRTSGAPMGNGSIGMVLSQSTTPEDDGYSGYSWLTQVMVPAANSGTPCKQPKSLPAPISSGPLTTTFQAYRDRFAKAYAARDITALVQGWDKAKFVIKQASGFPPVATYSGLVGHYTYLTTTYPTMSWRTYTAGYYDSDESAYEWFYWSFSGPNGSINGRGLVNWVKQSDGSWLQISEQDNCGSSF